MWAKEKQKFTRFEIFYKNHLQVVNFIPVKASTLGSSLAAWLSETVLRGRGPGASGFESHRRGRIFSKEGTSAGPWMCVYVFQGLDGRVVEGRATLFRHHREVGRVQIPAGWATHGCCVVFVLCRPERRKEKRGWAWVAEESTPESRRTT
jgi:hypothetical protein